MGLQAENVFKSFVFTEDEDQTKYDHVMDKFDSYFVPKRNVIHERAKFHMRAQGQGEPVESFIRSLHELAEHCEFDNKLEVIRDRLVIGIRDKEVSEKLQLRADLTLDKASEIARNSELVKSQIKDLQSHNLDAVKTHSFHAQGARSSIRQGQGRGRSSRTQRKSTGNSFSHQTCGRCNRKHAANQCPAIGQQCHKCKNLHHFAVCCKTKKPKQVTCSEILEEQSNSFDNETYFLGSVTNDNSIESWYVNLKVNNRILSFKIDTGADVSIISEQTFKRLRPKPKLTPVTSTLKSPGGTLKCLGKFVSVTKHKGQTYSLPLHVISGGHSDNLLSRNSAHGMGLIVMIEEVQQAQDPDKFGRMTGEPVNIVLRDNIKPYCLTTARRIPFPIMPKVKSELDRLERDGIIVKVIQPTDWCAPIVPVIKKNGDIRICVDLKHLNQAVKRETYMLPNLDDIAPKLHGSILFSKLDATSGFHQIPLDEKSSLLTTFITPFGRYCYKRLPFGITSASEIFQRRMTEILSGLDGVETIIDDVLVYGRSVSEHNTRLKLVLDRIRNSGIKLNNQKCEFRKERIEYFGHTICKEGILPSPQRLTAIQELPAPTNVSELRRTIGMIMYLGRFIPDLSSTIHPLTDLLKSDVVWTWDKPQIEAFDKVKLALTKAPVLAFYDPSNPITISADASSYGLGAALYQTIDKEMKPIAFASRTLTETERKYAQIEKECLAAVWACEKFDRYITGINSFRLITDHKPLVPLINTQDLDKTPLRCQRLLMRLRRYNSVAEHVPGKQLVVPDTLSRSPLKTTENSTEQDVNAYVNCISSSGIATDRKLQEICEMTQSDQVLQEAIHFTLHGWPVKEQSVKLEIREYFPFRHGFSYCDGLLYFHNRIVIPELMRAETLQSLHSGHLGLHKCRERAKISVWWPGISKDVEKLINSCEFCNTNRPTQRKEPLITTPMPDRPWQRIGTDLCDFEGKQFLIVMDYFSRFIEIVHLNSITSSEVIGKLKNIFARWGIPNEVVSDNGGQFASTIFREFASQYGFKHITSSPHFPQANGQAESGVKIAKRILKQPDIFMALMAYRSTPTHATGSSPAELIMGRKMRTIVPIHPDNLEPEWPNLELIRMKDTQAKRNMRKSFNLSHGARNLTPLSLGDKVRLKTDKEKHWNDTGVVVSANYRNRSYEVQTNHGKFRRNRRYISQTGNEPWKSSQTQEYLCSQIPCIPEPVNVTSENNLDPDATSPTDQVALNPSIASGSENTRDSNQEYRTRSGRSIVQPKYLRDYIT